MIELPPPSPALLLQEQWNNNTDKRRRRRKRHRQQQLRWDEELILVSMIMILLSQSSYQQDEDGDGYDDTDDTDETDDTDDCSLISGHTCNANGICKYCAMCLQSSCILSKSISPNTNNTSIAAPPAPVCNTTQFGTTDIYDWYGYCLSSGNDSDGDYCATSSECYQYRKNANSSVSYIWKNLTCEPTSCLLTTDRGQPPPAPGQLPPDNSNSDDTSEGGAAGSGHHRHSENGSRFSEHSPSAIALTATCSFIFLVGIIWIARIWMKSRKRRQATGGGSFHSNNDNNNPSTLRPTTAFSWIASFFSLSHKRKKRVRSLASDTSIPSTAPPSFSSNNTPEMQQRNRHATTAVASSSNSSLAGSQSSQQQRQREPLPSYYSPDPPPPKYEQAIVTQIRGLMARGELEEEDGDPTSSTNTAGHNSLPPPLWLPVYFTPNHSAYSFGRLRRHPPPHMAAPSSSSSSSSTSPPQPGQTTIPGNNNNNNNMTNDISIASSSSSSHPYHHDLWHHHTNHDWSDPLQAFWYHHQQQIGQPRPSPSTSSPATMDGSSRHHPMTRENPFSDQQVSSHNDTNSSSSTNDHHHSTSSSQAGLR